MNLNKIVKIEEPDKKERTRWALWHITFESPDGVQYVGAFNQDDYKLLMKFRSMVDAGVSSKDLEEFKDLVRAVADREHFADEAGSSL